jgi:glycosyltransferase involved in cell wall biosynthesis
VVESSETITRVKLNWFAPVPPTASSIAIDTAAILPRLAKHAAITVWAHELSWAPELEKHATVRRYDPEAMPWAEVNAADATIYHLGNHPDFHSPIWQVNRQHPGIVVLHDPGLQHFFAGLVERKLGLSPDEYRDMMSYYHPNGGAELANAFLLGARSAGDICDHCPLTSAALENATGVIVHTEVGYAALVRELNVPVAYVPLFALPGPDVQSDARRSPEPAPNGCYRLIMFGFLNANRRLSSVLRALRDFPQKQRFHLDIYGVVEDARTIEQLIAAFGLTELVHMHGFVSADELMAALERSDMAINLRDPTMGEASASQLRIWQHGLPSLVTDVGWYATVPENTVAMVRPEAEVEDIQYHLAEFLRGPEAYRTLGANGRRYVEEHHTVERYVHGVLEMVERTLVARSRQVASWMTARAGRAIQPWFAEDAAGLLLANPAEAIQQLAAGRGR